MKIQSSNRTRMVMCRLTPSEYKMLEAAQAEQNDPNTSVFVRRAIMKALAVKTCIVKGCTNRSDEGRFAVTMCYPCYEYIHEGTGIYSQAYRNAIAAAHVSTTVVNYTREQPKTKMVVVVVCGTREEYHRWCHENRMQHRSFSVCSYQDVSKVDGNIVKEVVTYGTYKLIPDWERIVRDLQSMVRPA